MTHDTADRHDRSTGDARPRNPFVFIVGCPRSGTTLLERMVDAHPQLAIMHESHWITRCYKKRRGVRRDGTVRPGLLDHLQANHRFTRLGLDLDEIKALIAADPPMRYADFVTAVFDRYGALRGKALVGDKTTGGYLRNLPLLHELWPKARVVHLVRDGRAVCLSMLTWPKAGRAAARSALWPDNPVMTTALWWRWHLQAGLDGAAALPADRYHELRYESMVRDPAAACAGICAFLGLPFDEGMVRFHEGRTSEEPGLSANRAWLPPTTGLRDWRTQMDPADVEQFEAIAGDTLAALGYERRFPEISRPVQALAERFERRWAAEIGPAAAGTTVPSG